MSEQFAKINLADFKKTMLRMDIKGLQDSFFANEISDVMLIMDASSSYARIETGTFYDRLEDMEIIETTRFGKWFNEDFDKLFKSLFFAALHTHIKSKSKQGLNRVLFASIYFFKTIIFDKLTVKEVPEFEVSIILDKLFDGIE